MQKTAKQDWEWKFIWKKEKENIIKVYGKRKTIVINSDYWKNLWDIQKKFIQNDINIYVVDNCLILLSTSKAYDIMM